MAIMRFLYSLIELFVWFTGAKIKQSGRILGHEVTAVPLESSIHSNNFCQLKQNRERDVIPSSRATTHLNTSRPHKKLSAQKPMISNRSRLVPIFSPQYTIVILLITLLHSFITTGKQFNNNYCNHFFF